jgi:uncharacterized protein YecT (DUF1311 family)
MRRTRNTFTGLVLLFSCASAGAVTCPDRVLSQTPAQFGPWPGKQVLRILQKPGSYGTCNAVAEIVAGGVVKASYTETAQNSIPGTAAYRFDIVHLVPGPYAQLAAYGWSTGADAGSSAYQVYAYQRGAVRRIFNASEEDGQLSIKVQNDTLTISGFRSTKCMACGYAASASWKWSPVFGGWLLVGGSPKAADFATYLQAPSVTANGDAASIHAQALAQYRSLTEQLEQRYTGLMRQANPAQRQALKAQEIHWIEGKRRRCGPSTPALQPGQGEALECLMGETRERLLMLSFGLTGIQD